MERWTHELMMGAEEQKKGRIKRKTRGKEVKKALKNNSFQKGIEERRTNTKR